VEYYNIFRLADHIRISVEYTETMLQGQTGWIAGIPNANASREYLVILDGGFFANPTLANKKVVIDSDFIEFA
jgi:hypothetical protein